MRIRMKLSKRSGASVPMGVSKTQAQNLREYAARTESIDELLLYIDYQCVRDRNLKAAGMKLAELIKKHKSKEIEVIRYMLGIFARWAMIESKRGNDHERPFKSIREKVIIRGMVVPLTALHIGWQRSFDPVESDAPVIKDPKGNPFIPGSSFKGVLRSFIEGFLAGANLPGI